MLKRDIRAQIIIIENGQFVLLKHHHKKENRYFWGLPGGGKEANETIEEAAIREAKEETGLDIKLLPYKHEVNLSGNGIYKRKATFIGYPISGVAKTGYDPEEESRIFYELVDLKWQSIYEIDEVDDITKSDVLPALEFIKSNPFIKRAGSLVYKKEDGIIKYLFTKFKNGSYYVFPQGHVENAGTAENAAIRETKEEAGVDIKIMKEIGFFFHDLNSKFYHTTIFLGKYLGLCNQIDDREVKWLTIKELKSLNLY